MRIWHKCMIAAMAALMVPATAQAMPAAHHHGGGGLSWSGQDWHVASGTFASGQSNCPDHVSVNGGSLFIQVANNCGGGVGGSLNTTGGTAGAGKYAIGLWPQNGSRPEVDFAEDSRGDSGRNEMTATYHPLPGCTQCIHSRISGDFTQFHTASVTRSGGGFTLSLDGHTWEHYSSSYGGAMHLFIHNEAWGDSGTSTLEVSNVSVN
jgi:hypothetical protein